MKKILSEKELIKIFKNNWKYIFLLFIFSIIMVYQSHKYESKILKISKLKDDLKESNSEFIYTRTLLMEMKNEENIKNKVEKTGLKDLKYPPQKIIIYKK